MNNLIRKERPSIGFISGSLLKSVGVQLKRTKTGIKFIYKDIVLGELEQLGFSLNVLKVQGGELPLPELAIHVDEQSSLEAYWAAQAEEARYKLQLLQDSYEFWYQSKYSKCFSFLRDQGIPKPTLKDIDACMAKKFLKAMRSKKEKIRKAEKKYRMLNNACYSAIVTKGKMLQSLRNIIQGGNSKMPTVDASVTDLSVEKIKVTQ